MRLANYLPTRTFELTVHTTDLATVLGVPPEVPTMAAVQTLHLVADLPIAHGLTGVESAWRSLWPVCFVGLVLVGRTDRA